MAMTVRELIEVLQGVDPNLPVFTGDEGEPFQEVQPGQGLWLVETKVCRIDRYPHEWVEMCDWRDEIDDGEVKVLEEKVVFYI